MCNTHCNEIGREANLVELSKRNELTFGGIATGVVERFSQKTGKPFGFITIEDFEGAGELALYGDDWTRWSSMMKENYTVYVTAKVSKRFAYGDSLEIKVQQVDQLYDVKQRKLDKLTITMSADKLNDTFVSELTAMVNNNPGDTQFYIQLSEQGEDGTVSLTSANKKVDVNRQLLSFIQSNDTNYYGSTDYIRKL